MGSSSSSRSADGRLKKRKRLGKRQRHFFYEFRRDVRQFFGAILGPVRPSVPCCFGAGRCSCYSSVSSSSSISRWADGIEKAEKVGKKTFFLGIQKGR